MNYSCCCAFHEQLYAEDFDSEEDLELETELGEDCLVFCKEFPNGVEMTRSGQTETACQCEAVSEVTLDRLSRQPVYSTTGKTLRPQYQAYQPTHLALFTIQCEITNCYRCRFCSKTFSSGQALGGHTSRRHAGATASHTAFPV